MGVHYHDSSTTQGSRKTKKTEQERAPRVRDRHGLFRVETARLGGARRRRTFLNYETPRSLTETTPHPRYFVAPWALVAIMQSGCKTLSMIGTEPELKKPANWGLPALEQVREARRLHQESGASQRSTWIRANKYFYGRIQKLLQFIVEPGKRVLELRCETGDSLACTKPAYGVGVEISEAMVTCAQGEHPELLFVRATRKSWNCTKPSITFCSITFSIPWISCARSNAFACTAMRARSWSS